MTDALAEHGRCEMLRQSDIAFFVSEGVPPLALVQDRAPVLRARVTFDGRFFEFARECSAPGKSDTVSLLETRPLTPIRHGAAAYVFLGCSMIGDPIDLIAWAPALNRLATWLGAVSMLGEDRLAGYRLAASLTVHETPLDWLRASRRGVCLVDERKAAPALREAGALSTRSWEHARRLRNLLRSPTPNVGVEKAEGVAG